MLQDTELTCVPKSLLDSKPSPSSIAVRSQMSIGISAKADRKSSGSPLRKTDDSDLNPVPRMKRRRFTVAGFILLAMGVPLSTANGMQQNRAVVQFDTGAIVSCRDLTNEEFIEHYPNSRLVEAIFHVSALHQGLDRHSVEHLIQIYSHDRSIQVMGFSPETTLVKDVTGVVAVEKTSEGSSSIGIDAVGTINSNAQLNGRASASGKTIRTERFEQVAPSYLVLASGLMARGSGAYFKVRSTPDTTLEGGQDYTLRIRVPEHWRGGSFQITSLASRLGGKDESRSTNNRVGASRFVVASFLSGDEEAERVATQYVQSEYELRRLAQRLSSEISKQAYPSMIDRLGKVMHVNQPKIPGDWLSQIVFSSHRQKASFEKHLPQAVQVAIDEWRIHHQQLQVLQRGIVDSTHMP